MLGGTTAADDDALPLAAGVALPDGLGAALAEALALAEPDGFADALALLDGEAVPQIVKRPTAVNTELTTGPSQHDFETRLFADLEPATRKWAIRSR